MKTSLIDTFKYVPNNKKKQLIVILFLLLVGISFEGLSFAIFIPALELIINNNFYYIEKFNIDKIFKIEELNSKILISFFLIAIVGIFLIKNSYLLFLNWFKNKFFKQVYTLNSIKLFDNYLELSWEEHLKKNSADIIRNIQNEVQKITITINAFLELLTEILVFIVILFFLILWNPKIVMFLIVLFGIIGFLFLFLFKKKINHWAAQIQENESAFFKNIRESIGSIKEIKILDKKNMFIDELNSRIKKAQESRLRFETIQQSPRFFLEFTSVLSISLLTIYFLILDYEMSEVLVNLGLIAISLFRIMPSTNRIVKNINDIRFGMNSVRIIEKEYALFEKKDENDENNKAKISFNNKIELKNIEFSYDESKKKIFNNLNFEVKKNSIIGIVGSSGSGKTTLIDILVGLILTKKGSLVFDGKEINNKNVKSYQRNFGYIPQNFYLFDNSVRQNIAINEYNSKNSTVNEDEIILSIIKDLKLKKILNEKGLDTHVGENAIKLSGGQRQRLGLARILFHNKEILLLDEATSALDKQTEKEIFDLIYSLRGKKTIIISTHSVEMLNNCDEVFEIKNNNLIKIK